MKRKIFLSVILVFMALFCLFTVNVSADDSYTVTYVLDDGTVYDTQTVATNGYAMLPDTPIKDGYVFVSWQCDGSEFSFRTRINENKVLTAKFDKIAEIEIYTVKFVVDGKVVSVQKVPENTAATAPAKVECPDGKVFSSWDKSFDNVTSDLTVNAILTDKEYTVDIIGFDGKVISSEKVKHGGNVNLPDDSAIPEVPGYDISQDAKFIGETENITCDGSVYVNYVPKKYRAEFYFDGDLFGDTVTVEYGKTVPFPKSVPERENYIFIGWYETENGSVMYNFNSTVSGDIRLYARFIPIEKTKYTVTFYNYDGNVYGVPQSVEEGADAIVPGDPIREGYNFIAWSVDFTNVTGNLEVYPVYEIKTYRVVIVDANGVLASYDVKYGGNVEEPDESGVAVPVGMRFIGWDAGFRNIREDTVINAKYAAKTYAVMFYTHNMKKIGVTQYVEYGKSAKAPILSDRDGYNFIGWFDGENYDKYLNITDDTVFIAAYEIKEYNVSFIDGDENVHSDTVKHGEHANMYLYDKENYIFIGWYTDASLENRYDFSGKVTGDIVLYAKWEKKPEVTYTVDFYVDGVLYKSMTVAHGSDAILPPPPVKYGYTFVSWSGSADNVTEDMKLDATFTKNKYKVTFVYGNGKTITSDVDYLEAALAPTETEIEGYKFIGWDRDFDSVSGDMTVNAVYEINRYTVRFFNGDILVSSQTVKYGQYAQMIGSPNRAGYVFTGWLDSDGNTFSFSNPIKADTDIHAGFKALEYTIYYYLDGKLYYSEKLTVGSEIKPIDPPYTDNDTKIFLGWSEIPEVMPAQNVVVTGSIYEYKYYVISYYVNGKLYTTESVREGAKIVPQDKPTDLDRNIIFNSWKDIPEIMPSHDIRIDADITVLGYYTIRYYVNGKLYYEQEILEGSSITPIPLPENTDDKIFKGWDKVPEFMPQNDVDVNAVYETVTIGKNVFKATLKDNGDGTFTATLAVGGNVRLTGLLATIRYGKDFKVTESRYDGKYADINILDGYSRFVWSHGENVTDDTVFLTLTLEFVGDGDVIPDNVFVDIDNIYEFTDDGEVSVPEYSVNYDYVPYND